jgi:5-methylcytosine-specific restriction endonuclease McrA
MSDPVPGLVAGCSRCRHRHLPDLPCWNGDRVPRFRALVFATYGTDCWLCGGPGADTVDHVQARAMGGTDALQNLRPAHAFCNTGRGAAPIPTPTTTMTTTDRW